MNMTTYVFDIETYPLTAEEMGSELNAVCVAKYAREKDKLLKQGVVEADAEEQLKYFQYSKPWFAFVQIIGVLKVVVRGTNKHTEFKSFYAASAADERALLVDFFNFVCPPSSVTPSRGYEQPLYVHFNGMDFDVPFILQRAVKQGLQLSQFKTTGFLNLVRFRTAPHYDIMQVMSNWGRNPISLDTACKFLGIQSPKDVLGGVGLVEYIAQGGDYSVYNKEDVLATYECFRRVYKTFNY